MIIYKRMQQPQYVPYAAKMQPPKMQQQQPQIYRQPQLPSTQTPQVGNQLDAKIQQQYVNYMATATPGQFKAVKLYVLVNDPTSMDCVKAVRSNSDLDKQVEIIDALPVENRPSWLKGVPSLINETGQFFLGPECIMWIRYQASQSVSAISETIGYSQVIPGQPSAMDGSAALVSSSMSHTSMVPQHFVTDQELLRSIGGDKASQRFDGAMVNRDQINIPAAPGGMLPEQYRAQQVGRGNGNAEQLNTMMEKIQQDRQKLLNAPQQHHMNQQRMGGWNPAQPEKVERGRVTDSGRVAQLEQERNGLRVQMPQRQFF